MKEQFDKKLVDKIKASFDNHKEEYDPQQWEKLSSTYFAPKSGGFSASYLYWAAAAIVAVLGLSVLFYQLEFKLSEERPALSDNIVIEQPVISQTDSNKKDSTEDLERNNSKEATRPDIPAKKPVTSSPTEDALEPTQKQSRESVLLAERPNKTQNAGQSHPERTSSYGENESHEANLIEQYSRAAKEAEAKLLAQIQEENEEKVALAAIKEWLGEDETITDKKENIPLNPLRLGVLVTPQTTTSSNQTMNLGAGIMSEFSLSKKFKIDLGVAYATQNLNPTAPRGMDFSSADAPSARSAMFTNNYINTSSELRFGQIEIPLNLKFKVMDKAESGIYLVSGVSNMFYINQQNVVTYNTANIQTLGLMSADAMVQSFTETQTPNNTTDGGNVGQLINFGFGYERNLSSGTYISIEPFYKMSLGNQTFINQQFSIGGINLRMNFQLKK